YDCETGRWLSRDPIGEIGGNNLYDYVANNPLNRRDRLGLCDNTSTPEKTDEEAVLCSPEPSDVAAEDQSIGTERRVGEDLQTGAAYGLFVDKAAQPLSLGNTEGQLADKVGGQAAGYIAAQATGVSDESAAGTANGLGKTMVDTANKEELIM